MNGDALRGAGSPSIVDAGVGEWSVVALTSREPIARAITAVMTLLFGVAGLSISVSGHLPEPMVIVTAVASASTVALAVAWVRCSGWPGQRTSIAFVTYADTALTVVLLSIADRSLALPLCGGYAIVAIYAVVATTTKVFLAHLIVTGTVLAIIGAAAIGGEQDIWMVMAGMLAITGTLGCSLIFRAYTHHLRRWVHRALYDPLTGVLNIRGLFEALEHSGANRPPPDPEAQFIGLTIVDIDRFRHINESHGDAGGDAALVAVADRLVGAATGNTVVARLRSDQFTSVYVGAADDVAAAGRRVRAAMQNPFVDPPFTASVESAGPVTVLVSDTTSGVVRRLLAVADIELLRRRAENGSDTRFTAPPEPILDAGVVRDRVREAITTRGLVPVFQPICDTQEQCVVGYEALTRFPPGHGSPLTWFRDATEAGIGAELEMAAVTTALSAAQGLPASAFVSLNVSARTLLAHDVAELFRSHPNTRKLCVEITEHDRFDDYRAVVAVVADLRGAGVSVAVDDVGAGFASMRLVVECKPDVVKIDHGLTHGMDSDPARRAGAAALVTFAHSVGAAVIVEGVETVGELAVAADLGADMVQGYLLGRPEPAMSNAARYPKTSAGPIVAPGPA